MQERCIDERIYIRLYQNANRYRLLFVFSFGIYKFIRGKNYKYDGAVECLYSLLTSIFIPII